MVFLSVSRMILMCFSSKTIKNVRFRAVSTNRTYHYIYIYIYCQGVLGKIHKIFQIFFKSKKNDVIFTKNAQNSFVFICFCLYLRVFIRNDAEWVKTNEFHSFSRKTHHFWRWRRILTAFRWSVRHAYRIINIRAFFFPKYTPLPLGILCWPLGGLFWFYIKILV